MSITKLISNYSSFNEWANNKIADWLTGLDKEILYRKTPSSFDTIDHTLQHILRVQKFWLAFISEQDTSNFNWAVREGEVENILSELKTVSNQMKEKFTSFTGAELSHTLELNMPWAKNNLSRYEYVIHVINHSTYHRGQIITMARSLGINEDIVNTDYNFFNIR